MILIIGLGNPGKKYQKTRHNVGFRVVEKAALKLGLSDFKPFSALQAEISSGNFSQEKIIIAKPQTFMNSSGEAVKKIISWWKIPPEKLIVVHDDLDISLGKIKISKNRGTAGHKGVASIVEKISSRDFCRIRIGILAKKEPRNPERFVLDKLSRAEEKIFSEVLDKATNAIEIILQEGQEKAANQFN